jgi:putative PEP-CTERM system histidine kinase
MAGFAAASVFGGLGLRPGETLESSLAWLQASLITQSLIPGFWICFSLIFARGNRREFLVRWRFFLAAAFIVPAAIALVYPTGLLRIGRTESIGGSVAVLEVGTAGKALAITLMMAAVAVLANLEKTFRAAIGTTRWRVKFLIIGLGMIFSTQIYTLSQTLLFPSYNPAMTAVDSGALFIGCCLMAVGYSRSSFADLEVYPSQEALRGSMTILVVGAYLFVVGFLAEAVKFLGGVGSFSAQAFVVMLGVMGIAVLLVSDRFKTWRQRFVSRNFSRPQYDFRKVWEQFSQQLTGVFGSEQLCAATSRLIADTLNVLSTNILLLAPHQEQLVLISSTSRTGDSGAESELDPDASASIIEGLEEIGEPFDLDTCKFPWAESIRSLTPVQFPHGGNRFCVRLISGGQIIGLMVVSDRVNGLVYMQEELDLLKCIADELAARLASQNLTDALVQAREMEAFQAMSAFFVHDMKNAASSLNLTLQNLPIHFDDPEFREDALRGIAKTADRISKLTDRLGSLGKKLDLELVEIDLNEIVQAVLADLVGVLGVEVKKDLRPLPKIMVDREQMRSVVTNLILNAQDAVLDDRPSGVGTIWIETSHHGRKVELSVRDDGCGMSADFVKNSLFQPLQSTKKQGLGIGVFQARMIVEALGGSIKVDSVLGEGTTFRIGFSANG